MVTVTFVGVGKLGLAYAAYISSKGHTVHCIDINSKMIDAYSRDEFGTLEPEVEHLARQFPMTYSSDFGTVIPGSICIILVNTPTCLAGYDHSWLESALARLQNGPQTATIITSTVQPGFCERQAFEVIYNPLFVQIGNVIANLRSVSDVLIGGKLSPEVEEFYRSIFGADVKLHVMPYKVAEVAKLALNSYITMKISFANMIGDALRTCGHDATPALEFIGSDSRIGSKCFKYGWGYGGPCFPRDNRALSTFLREMGSYDYLPVASHESNERHAVEQAKHFQGDTLTGLCYKEDCVVPILEESHKVKTALILKSMGRHVKLEDAQNVLELLPRELQ